MLKLDLFELSAFCLPLPSLSPSDGYPAAYQLFMYTLQCYQPSVISVTTKQVGGARWAGLMGGADG